MNRQTKIKTLCSLFEPSSQKICIIEYGSMDNESDIDLLIISKDLHSFSDINIADLDVRFICEQELNNYLLFRDIVYTEPILTGNQVFGNIDFLQKQKQILNETKSSQLCIFYLLSNSSNLLFSAYKSIKNDNLNYKDISLNLSYALSYYYFSKWYSLNEELITAKELRKQFIEYEELWDIYQEIKKKKESKKELEEFAKIIGEKLMGLTPH